MPCDLCFSHSENTQYQMLYSRGAGVIHVLGVVPQSKLLQTHIIEYKYDTFCSAASMARPWIIFVGMLVAFLIVTGQYRGGASD